MKTNEQTPEQLLKDTKESLILKGIASNIIAMQFPKMKNLSDMLAYFEYDVVPIPAKVDSNNLVATFYKDNGNIKRAIDEFNFNLLKSKKTVVGTKTISVYDGLLKKITLCESTMSLYGHENDEINLIDFEKEHYRYYDLIEFMSKNEFVLAPNLPIFKYNDLTYSIDELKFDNKLLLFNYINNLTEIFFVYQIKIYTDDSIILRSVKIKQPVPVLVTE